LGLQAGHHPGRPLEYPGRLAEAEIEGFVPGDSKKISIAEVNHVAKLARLRLSGSEAKAYQRDLNSILEYMETLKELDTEETLPMSHVFTVKNVWREDTPGRTKAAKSVLSNAPLKERGYYKVPRILEG
jgi:aspartyl/glutamyl-tRNA(Asn/Gln) amidotransferase C subunit